MTQNWRTDLADAEALAVAVIEHDKKNAPGFAVALVRAVVARLSDDDAVSLIKQAKPVSVDGMIG
jgi:hypothetical protein